MLESVKSFTFIAGTTMSNDSSPLERTGSLMVSTCDSIEIRLYSRAMVLMRQEKLSGSWQAGWNDVPLPSSWLNGLANGHYYF